MSAISLCLYGLAIVAIALVASRSRGAIAGWVIAAIVALVIAQFFIEGWRWQSVPFLALTIVLVLASARGLFVTLSQGTVTLAVLSSFFLIIAVTVNALFPIPVFPLPTGNMGVGTITKFFTDPSRPASFDERTQLGRTIAVQFWYPARKSEHPLYAHYVPDGTALAPLAKLLGLPPWFLTHLSQAKTHAVVDAEALNGRYPVLLFSPGRGGYRQQNTAEFEDLASHGFIVASIDHTSAVSGVVLPGGRIQFMDPRMRDRRFVDAHLSTLSQDVTLVIDNLAELNAPRGSLPSRIDMARLGIFGVSLGGEVAALACQSDSRIRACLITDVWLPKAVLPKPLTKPVMFIGRDAATMLQEGWAPRDVTETSVTMNFAYESAQAGACRLLIPGAFHADFSDAPLLSPASPLLGLSGPAHGDAVMRDVSNATRIFFTSAFKDGPWHTSSLRPSDSRIECRAPAREFIPPRG